MPPRKTHLDQLDYHIIRLLHDDARLSAAQIARRVNANERTIRKRLDRLVSTGALRLAAIIDPEAFGYLTAADIFLEVSADQEASALEHLMAMPEVTYLALGQDTREISIEARCKDNEALRQFLGRTLPAIPGVTVTRYALVPRILRNIDAWMPAREDFTSSSEQSFSPENLSRKDQTHAPSPLH